MVPKASTFLIKFITFVLIHLLKIDIMISKKLGLYNSVYQSGYAGAGSNLTVKNGRLINNSGCGETGIAEMARLRKAAKREEKVMIAEGYSRGEMMSEMREMLNGLD